jgi:transketolase
MVNMTVLSIGDPIMVKDILRANMDYPGPISIRLAQGKADAVIYEPGTMKYTIGKGIVANEGDDATIFAHGEMVRQALGVARDLKKEGLSVRVIDMFTIKPLDVQLVLSCIRETKNILVWEDHVMNGGLASAISDAITDNGVYPAGFKRLGIPQVWAGFGSGEEQRIKYGYDTEAAKNAIRVMTGMGA